MDQEQMIKKMCDQDLQLIALESKYGEICSKYDDLREKTVQKQEFLTLWEEFNYKLSKDFEAVRNDILLLKQENKNLIQKLENLQIEHCSHLNIHDDEINKQKCHVEQLGKDINLSLIKDTYHTKDIEILNAKIANCEKISPDYAEFKQKLINYMKEASFIDLQNENGIGDLYNIFNENKASNNSHFASIQDLDKVYSKKLSLLEERFESQRLDNLSQLSSLSIQMNEKIDKLPKAKDQVIPDVKPIIENLSANYQKKIEEMTLDVSNAKTKSDVNEMQLKLVDKKLENIYLLLKKQDLTL